MDIPQDYKTAGILMLCSGILNALTALGALLALALAVFVFAVGTWGAGLLGMICCIEPLIPLVMGLIEVFVGIRAIGGHPVRRALFVSVAGIVGAVLVGIAVVWVFPLLACISIVSVILEIIAIVMLVKPEVNAFLAQDAVMDATTAG